MTASHPALKKKKKKVNVKFFLFLSLSHLQGRFFTASRSCNSTLAARVTGSGSREILHSPSPTTGTSPQDFHSRLSVLEGPTTLNLHSFWT